MYEYGSEIHIAADSSLCSVVVYVNINIDCLLGNFLHMQDQ